MSSTGAPKYTQVNAAAKKHRLPDDVVLSIFDCLRSGKPAPNEPKFSFVEVPAEYKRQVLSPPPYEFENGLYVLLRPQTKNRQGTVVVRPKPPQHLDHLLDTEAKHKPVCPWGLSGPQSKVQNPKVEQRYCYPKGNSGYSKAMASTLWTLYLDEKNDKGKRKEDDEYRLLHVYYSEKRAAGNGGTYAEDDSCSKRSFEEIVPSPSPQPPLKRIHMGSSSVLKPRSVHAHSPPRSIFRRHRMQEEAFYSSPTIIGSSRSSSEPQQQSPDSLDTSPRSSPPTTPLFASHRAPSPINGLRRGAAEHNIRMSPLYRTAMREDDESIEPFTASSALSESPSWNDNWDRQDAHSPFPVTLSNLTDSLQNRIYAARADDQKALRGQLSSWASSMSNEPFLDPMMYARADEKEELVGDMHEV